VTSFERLSIMIHSDLKSSALLTQTFAVLSENMISISSTGTGTGTGTDLLSTGYNQWRGQREFKVGGDEPCEPTVRLPD